MNNETMTINKTKNKQNSDLGTHSISPWQLLSREKLQSARKILNAQVPGQESAVKKVSEMILRAHFNSINPKRFISPKGRMLFVGTTGVGKTKLAKAVAEFVFGDDSAFIRFDMSEYSHEHSYDRLIGARPGYIGFEDGGQLTNAVREKPFSVILFNEIEKAHSRVLDIFLQILDYGELTDRNGETVDFSESVIIFTSNIGDSSMPVTDDPAEIKNHFVRSVEDYFINKLSCPEFLNRLGQNVVVFDKITDDTVRTAILEKNLKTLTNNLHERFGISLEISREVENMLLESADNRGGRYLLSVVEDRLVHPLSWFLFEREDQLREGQTINIAMQNDDLHFELQENSNYG